MKSQWLDDTLRFNITYFDADYDDLQVTAIDQSTGAFVYSNKADASVDGSEAEFVYVPQDNLTVLANVILTPFGSQGFGDTKLTPLIGGGIGFVD